MRAPAPLLVAFLLAGCSAALAAQTPRRTAPTLVLLGGKVFTADPARPWAEAIAIRGERIVAVGGNAEIARLAGPATRRIDVAGRVVVPGFNDAHDHVGGPEFGVAFGTSARADDPPFSEVLDSLRALVRRAPAGTWLHTTVGVRIFEDLHADRAALDRVAPDHPVLLWGWTGHDMLVNTRALRALGVAENARDPLGGSFQRDTAGRLTGWLREYAEFNALRRFYSSLPDSALIGRFRRYAAEGLSLGITSVQVMNGDLDPQATTRVLQAARLPLRVRIIPFSMTDTAGLRESEWSGVPRQLAPRTVVSGVKWILDGSPLERRALMRAPYADRPGWYGQLDFPISTVRAILQRALVTREPLHLHISGDSTPRLVFALMRSLAPDSAWRPLRVRIEHGDHISGDLLPVARSLGVVVVENPIHFDMDPALLRARFGRVPPGMFLARSLVAAGIPFAIGSDGPRNPFVNLMFAITHPLSPGEALAREQAVAAYTRGSAYAEFAEQDKGTLAPGFLADLTVLSQDIFTVAPGTLPATRAVLTVVGGEVVYDAGAVAEGSGRTGAPEAAREQRLTEPEAARPAPRPTGPPD